MFIPDLDSTPRHPRGYNEKRITAPHQAYRWRYFMKSRSPTKSTPDEKRTEHPHITRVKGVRDGRPIIRGSGMPVWLIASFYKAGDTVEEIHHHYPHLRASWVYDAISYYLDHMEEIERELLENREEYIIEKYGLKPDERGFVRIAVKPIHN